MDVLTQELVSIRNLNTCFMCGRHFPVGIKRGFSTSVDGDTAYNSYLCGTCLGVGTETHSAKL